MSTVVSGYKNDKDILLKGAPERIVQKCVKYMSFEGEKQMSKTEQD
jgi:magnesium-transporting ATPase (P-type)